MWNNSFAAMTLLLAIFALNACHTSKKTARTTLPTEIEASEICYYVLNNQPDIQTIDISRMNVNIQFGAQSFSTRGSMRMIRDSVIIISVQPLAGIEMGRARITKDSIIVIDRFNSRYFAENIEFMAQIFDFALLQSLFANQIFQNKDFSKQNMVFIPFPDGCELRTSNDRYDFNFFVNRNLEKTIITDQKEPYSLTVEYSDFEKNGNFEFPNKLRFTLFEGQRRHRMEFSIQRIDFNKPVNATFSIPSRFKRADIQEFSF